MSDPSYQPKQFLYLPASQALVLAHAAPPPGRSVNAQGLTMLDATI